MNYNPGQSYRGDVYIAQGNQMWARIAEGLIGDMINRGRQREGAQATLDALGRYGANGEETGADEGGFDPTTAGNGTAPDEAADTTGDASEAPDQWEAQGKKADTIRSLLTQYNPNLKGATKAMSLEQLEGTLKGYSVASAMQEHQAKMKDYAAQAALREQGAADDRSIGAALNRYASAGDVPDTDPDTGEDITRPPTQEERFRFALGTPGLAGRAVPRLIDSLTKYGQATNPDGTLTPKYTEDPITGARTLTYGKQALPTGYNPSKAQPQFAPQHDSEGNLIGWSQTDARGHATFHPNKGGPLKQAVDGDGNPLMGYYVGPDGKVLDTRSALQKSMGSMLPNAAGAQPVKAGAGAVKPIPKKKEDLQKGQKYQTARGVAMWNGSQFVQ